MQCSSNADKPGKKLPYSVLRSMAVIRLEEKRFQIFKDATKDRSLPSG